MGFFAKILGKRDPTPAPGSEHAVLVYFTYDSTDLSRLFALEEQLEQVISEAKVGELDGNEVAADGSDGTPFQYGPDAEKLFAAVAAEGVKETVVVLGT